MINQKDSTMGRSSDRMTSVSVKAFEELKEKAARADKLEKDNQKLTEKTNELKKDVAKLTNAWKHEQDENAKLEEDLDKLNTEKTEAVEELEQLKEEMEELEESSGEFGPITCTFLPKNCPLTRAQIVNSHRNQQDC
jgi:DNA repair exonuclease SbcCD ATPase subunit